MTNYIESEILRLLSLNIGLTYEQIISIVMSNAFQIFKQEIEQDESSKNPELNPNEVKSNGESSNSGDLKPKEEEKSEYNGESPYFAGVDLDSKFKEEKDDYTSSEESSGYEDEEHYEERSE